MSHACTLAGEMVSIGAMCVDIAQRGLGYACGKGLDVRHASGRTERGDEQCGS